MITKSQPEPNAWAELEAACDEGVAFFTHFKAAIQRLHAQEANSTSTVQPRQELLMTVDETACRLSLCRNQVYNLMRRGMIPSVKIGASRRVSVTALEAFIRALEAGNTP